MSRNRVIVKILTCALGLDMKRMSMKSEVHQEQPRRLTSVNMEPPLGIGFTQPSAENINEVSVSL